MSNDDKGLVKSRSWRIRKELFRKLIHIAGFMVPFIAIILGNAFAAAFIVGLAVIYTISEYLRLKGRNMPVFTTITKMAMRDSAEEKQNAFVRAPLYFAAGILASLLIFPAPFNYAAIAVVTLGDGFASVVGRLAGKTKIPHSGGKTLEGTAAGIVCALVGAMIFVSPATALTAALVGMTVELVQLRVSDNLSVPLSSGIVITVIGNV